MNEDVIIVNIIGDVISSMSVTGVTSINYQPGRIINVVESLVVMDNSIGDKGKKYPLFAMLLPIYERRGSSIGYYARVKIPRIVIAVMSVNPNDTVISRYSNTGVYTNILYPCYYEFLNKLTQSKWIINKDPESFEHTKFDNPGKQPISKGSNDFVDTIEIQNLEIIINQLKTC